MSDIDPIPVRYAPGARDSDLPIRAAAAIALRSPRGRVLVARRNPDFVEEFRGDWSLPSVFVPQGAQAVALLRARLKEWFELVIPEPVLIARRFALRPAWRLRMDLHETDVEAELELRAVAPKYDAVRWVDGVEFFEPLSPDRLGDCARSFLDHERSGSGG